MKSCTFIDQVRKLIHHHYWLLSFLTLPNALLSGLNISSGKYTVRIIILFCQPAVFNTWPSECCPFVYACVWTRPAGWSFRTRTEYLLCTWLHHYTTIGIPGRPHTHTPTSMSITTGMLPEWLPSWPVSRASSLATAESPLRGTPFSSFWWMILSYFKSISPVRTNASQM